MEVGFLIIATNKYTEFIPNLIESADKYFLPNHEVTYFFFTNKDMVIETGRNLITNKIEHRDWPWMTLGRYSIFEQHSNQLKDMDYLFYCDADMLFVDTVGDEILSDRVATQHAGYYGRRGAPETNPLSTAYVGTNEEMQYFAGGFNGGSSESYLKMSSTIAENTKKDYENGIIAVWHDESHLNRYLIDNPPSMILDPSYCCYENWVDCPFGKRLLALVKKHEEYR